MGKPPNIQFAHSMEDSDKFYDPSDGDDFIVLVPISLWLHSEFNVNYFLIWTANPRTDDYNLYEYYIVCCQTENWFYGEALEHIRTQTYLLDQEIEDVASQHGLNILFESVAAWNRGPLKSVKSE